MYYDFKKLKSIHHQLIFHPSLCLLHIQLLLQQIQAPHKQLAIKMSSLIPVKSPTQKSGEKILEVVTEIRRIRLGSKREKPEST
jgi:hypothetical protein